MRVCLTDESHVAEYSLFLGARLLAEMKETGLAVQHCSAVGGRKGKANDKGGR